MYPNDDVPVVQLGLDAGRFGPWRYALSGIWPA